MSTCSEIRKLLPVISDSANPVDYERIMRHLRECPLCRSIQEDYLAVDLASAELDVPDPGAKYWEEFAPRVQRRISEKRGRSQLPAIKWLIYRPAYSWPAAVAALVLVFFITRAMLPENKIILGGRTDANSITELAEDSTRLGGEEFVGAPAVPGGVLSEPERGAAGELAEKTDYAAVDRQSPKVAASDIPPEPTSERAEGRTPSYNPDEVPVEELKSVLAARERNDALADLPERKTIILRGDTTSAELSDKDLPEGKELELAERPYAPFPAGDDTGGAAENRPGLASPLGQNYTAVDRPYPALNKNEFTAEDREFFEQRIKEITGELARPIPDNKRRDLCRELVDMYYQLAINWKAEADIKAAREYIEKAREILRKEDYADLDAKAGALKSLLNK